MEKQPSSRTCFLCGRENDAGLRMAWYNDYAARQVVAQITVPERFNGYPGVVHGGIVAALLDETAGRALLLDGDTDRLMVTLKLEVKYRHPTPAGEPLTVVGWVLKASRDRARVAAELRLRDGTVTAEAEAILVRPSSDIFERWEPERKHWRVYDEG